MRISDWSSDVCSSALRGAVQHDRVLANDFVEDVPDFLAFLLDPLLCLLQGHRQTLGAETRIDERLEQFERHLLRQAALVQLEFGTEIGSASCRERVCQYV